MIRKLTCIECPQGCQLIVDIENCKVLKVSGNKCPKGQTYAITEIENPLRILTATIVSEDLSLKMVPVRTDKAIPKSMLFEAMEEIRKIRIGNTVSAGDVVCSKFLGMDVNLIATRSVSKMNTIKDNI